MTQSASIGTLSNDRFLGDLATVGALAGGGGALGGVLGLILGAIVNLVWPSACVDVAAWVQLGGALFSLFVLCYVAFTALGV